ncbi:hypothetical protein LNTAR_02894 [Lentisphaera araneosa HTCC2155]|uniref:DoxX family protein n=1 Tax=Lentisphaera araneosa HTCC2155 TaxID=313628 RepID=A6DTE1_9BACT|nr:DoxX family protein [Lentisphaera araneosa]EDM25121.1 hypothetical protein LNTAR_02894 [Lentisphaera araneosa HTCC2155]
MSQENTPKLSTDMALLLARIAFGGSMLIAHGWPKLQNFSTVSEKFPALFGLSSSICLGLAVFAEFFCAILLILGLVSRFALSQLIITMSVGVYVNLFIFQRQLFDSPGKPSAELAFIYLMTYVVLIILGPGRVSLDAVISKKRAHKKDNPKKK